VPTRGTGAGSAEHDHTLSLMPMISKTSNYHSKPVRHGTASDVHHVDA